ncbi:transmembrane protein, putative [Bodo saltans]|uniref:Transmembrane protein, putative n=1 Tax=Bodo saltans TaxID=75058 RepID=A0A0S4JBL1_BODSA|nr:transmembrane protein, putative [Bodo saltans]|eukprot:CUG88781.1 transmembrane protein, putative [Bodo saltans]
MHPDHIESDTDSGFNLGGATMSTEDLRAGLFRASIGRIIVSLILVGTFWISYTWLIASILLTFSFGAIGVIHFSTQEALYHNHCCCAPRPAVLFLYYATIVNVPLAIVGLVSSLFAVISAENDGDGSVVSIVVLADCTLLLAVEVYFFARCRVMRLRMNDDGGNTYDQNTNQVGPEVVQVWAYRNEYGQSVEMGQMDGNGNLLPSSTSTTTARTPGVTLSRHASVGPVVGSRPVVFGYPVTQEIHISVQPSPFARRGEADLMNRGHMDVHEGSVVCHYGPHSTPEFVSTAGMLGYGDVPAPPPPANESSPDTGDAAPPPAQQQNLFQHNPQHPEEDLL